MLKKETLDALNDAKKNLINAINLNRTDIVVSLLKEWFKKVESSANQELTERKYFFNEAYCDSNTKTPLQVAFNSQNRDIVRALLTFGADPSIKDLQTQKSMYQVINESTDMSMKQILSDTLFQAIVQNDINQIRQFIASGFDLNTNENLIDGNSLLHWAAIYSNESVIRLLLDNKANVHSLNKSGCTPLHEFLAAKRKDLKIVELLLQAKTDLMLKARDGLFKDKSVIDICSNDPELCALIAEYSHEFINEPIQSCTKIESTKQEIKIKSIDLSKWFENDMNENKVNPMDLLWPKPQLITLIDESSNQLFKMPAMDKCILIYTQIPHTCSNFIESLKSLARSYSSHQFDFICKKKEFSQIQISIDENLFHIENAYTINIKQTLIEIVGKDIVACQYAFSTLLQLFKIYSNTGVPLMRIFDYPNVKYRGILIDFSQGFHINLNYFLSLIQMIAFYKLNQLHVYIRVSSTQHDKKQWFDCIENWFEVVKFSQEHHVDIIPTIDICNDVSDLEEVLLSIKEFLDLFQESKFINIGPRLSSMLICVDNKNPLDLGSNQYIMLCSYLIHNSDSSIEMELERFNKLILMEYGIKIGHDFDVKCKSLVRFGKPFYLCVGSSNWNSLFGSHEGCLLNIFDAYKSVQKYKPLGMLLCNFSGSLQKTSHTLNLVSLLMFASPAWNENTNLNEFLEIFPHVLRTHGIMCDNDGHLSMLTLELGHIETYLTRKEANRIDLDGFPLDSGSILTHLLTNSDEVKLDNIDLPLLKKSLAGIKKIQTKFKQISNLDATGSFREVSVFIELSILLVKFLMSLYISGTKKQAHTVGLNVINIGVSNLPETIRTDVANKMITIIAQLEIIWSTVYFNQSLPNQSANYHKFIQKLLNKIGLSMENGEYKVSSPSHLSRSFSQSIYFRDDE